MKIFTVLTSALLLAGPVGFASAKPLYAPDQVGARGADGAAMTADAMRAGNHRCGGISYGTGARSCGTASGGPVGGISSRN